MRPLGIVSGNPRSDDTASMADAEEQALVEQLIAHSPVETLDISVLHRLARGDVMPVYVAILRPGEDGVGGGLRVAIDTIMPGLSRRAMRQSARERRGGRRSRCLGRPPGTLSSHRRRC